MKHERPQQAETPSDAGESRRDHLRELELDVKPMIRVPAHELWTPPPPTKVDVIAQRLTQACMFFFGLAVLCAGAIYVLKSGFRAKDASALFAGARDAIGEHVGDPATADAPAGTSEASSPTLEHSPAGTADAPPVDDT